MTISDSVKVSEPSLRETLDWIPIVSTGAGALRKVLGCAQVITGVVTIPFEILARVFCSRKEPFIMVRGVSNIVRGSIALFPIVGNLTLYFYDHTQFKMNVQRLFHTVHQD